MSKDKLNDENFGTRDKRGHWKPFGKISINPPLNIFYNPIKLFKYFFKYPGIFFPWTFVFGAITVATYFFQTPSLETMKNFEVGWISYIFFSGYFDGLMQLFHKFMKMDSFSSTFKGNARFHTAIIQQIHQVTFTNTNAAIYVQRVESTRLIDNRQTCSFCQLIRFSFNK